MKINELLKDFQIYMTNEEKEILQRVEGLRPMEAYTEREQVVIENLIRKSLISKVKHNNTFMVQRND